MYGGWNRWGCIYKLLFHGLHTTIEKLIKIIVKKLKYHAEFRYALLLDFFFSEFSEQLRRLSSFSNSTTSLEIFNPNLFTALLCDSLKM